MNNDWKKFLKTKGANIHEGVTVDFAEPGAELNAAAKGDVICDLSHLDRLRVSGKDAEEFLLNQLSNDIRSLDDKHSQLSTYCNPKGRMLGLFRIYRDRDGFLLLSDNAIGSALLARLKMFVMRSKVDIENITDTQVVIGISGDQAAKVLTTTAGTTLPESVDGLVQADGMTIIRQHGNPVRYLILGEPSKLTALWDQLAPQCTPVGRAAWEWLDIRAGVPALFPETSEQFIPQMLNLDILNALNFKKGCYPGQEIIARMKYLGKLKQRMFPGHVDANDVKPGDPIYAPGFGSQSAGTVVNARPSPAGGTDLLFIAQLKAVADGELHYASETGATIELKDLPYTIPTEGETAA